MISVALAGLVLLVFANAVFVAFEFALVAARRSVIEAQAEAGVRAAQRALRATSSLGDQIAGVQLGITMASLGLGALVEPNLEQLFESATASGQLLPDSVVRPLAYGLALLVVVFFHSVFGEMVPKNLSIASAERSLLLLSRPMELFVGLFRPLIRVLDGLAGLGLRLLRVERRDELMSAATAEELVRIVTESGEGGFIAVEEQALLARAIELGSRPASSAMIARGSIVTVPLTVTVADAEAVLLASGHSRIPVVGRGIDDVRGYIHAKDLLAVPDGDRGLALPLRSIRRMLLVSTDRTLDDVLLAMRRSRLHVALVLDRDARTAGLVTLEDVLEQLVGAIRDETDRDRPGAQG